MAVKVTGKVIGMDKVLKKLNREITGVRGRTRGGLRLAALHILRVAHPLVPMDTPEHLGGNLRKTRFTRAFDGPDGPMVELGYDAAYAAARHEIQAKNYSTPGTQWKYLETAAKNEVANVVEIVRREARVRGGR